MWSGRPGWSTPAPASVRAVKSLVVTWLATRPRSGDMDRMLSRGRQTHARRQRAVVDQPPDLGRAARVEEHVPLSDRRLLRQHPGLQQRLPHLLRERALVAGEPAREVREVGVVAA